MAKERESGQRLADIRERTVIVFGNGGLVTLLDVLPENEERKKRMLIKPTRTFLHIYKIPDKDLDDDGNLEVEVPEEMVVVINDSPKTPMWLVKCGPKGEDTALCESEKVYLTTIKTLQAQKRKYEEELDSLVRVIERLKQVDIEQYLQVQIENAVNKVISHIRRGV